MKTMKGWARAGVLLALPVAACSTIVGADFDDLGPLGASGSSAGSVTGGSGGTEGGTTGGLDKTMGGAGAGADPGGASPGGGSPGGAPAGGVGGEPNGGVPTDGGTPAGGAGMGGEGGGGGAGGEPPVAPTDVVINELKGQGSGDDYIELYNPGTQTADVGGCYVVDDSNNRVSLPVGATIAPKGYVVIRLQQTASTGMVTTCFGFTPCYDGVQWGISAKGEVIFLHDSQGVLLDQLTYPSEDTPANVGDGNAFGRIPSGGTTTGRILTSPGATNNAVP